MGSSDRSPRGLRKVAVSATGREGGSSPDLPAESANGRFSKGLEEGRAALGAAIGRAMHQLAIEVLKLEEGQQPDKATSACFDIISVATPDHSKISQMFFTKPVPQAQRRWRSIWWTWMSKWATMTILLT